VWVRGGRAAWISIRPASSPAWPAPEDCGGPWGYANYLAAIADPRHERHEELLEWRGPFDPEAFDAKKATRAMRKVT
jgi:hypothetical protein